MAMRPRYRATACVSHRFVLAGCVLLAVSGWRSVDVFRLRILGIEATAHVTGFSRIKDAATGTGGPKARSVTYAWTHAGQHYRGADVVSVDWSPPHNGRVVIRFWSKPGSPPEAATSGLLETLPGFPPLLLLAGLVLVATGAALSYGTSPGTPSTEPSSHG